MLMIQIDKEIKGRCPQAALGIMQCMVNVEKSTPPLLTEFYTAVEQIREQIKTNDIADLLHVAETRAAYKALGKNPHRYRNSAESMLRRISQGKDLYEINNVVEINNLLSVRSGYSLGSYDISHIAGNVLWKRAPEGETYQGIGKEMVNIENLPVLYDMKGPFGNPTSDCRRAMITEGNREICMVVYAFDGSEDILPIFDDACRLLKQYCGAASFRSSIIE